MQTLLARVLNVEDGEAAPAGLAFTCFFSLMTAYGLLRPLRDEMGVARGVENLPGIYLSREHASRAALPETSPCPSLVAAS